MEWIGGMSPKPTPSGLVDCSGDFPHEQIRDAFRAAQYTPEEVEAFASAFELRVAELNQLCVGGAAR